MPAAGRLPNYWGRFGDSLLFGSFLLLTISRTKLLLAHARNRMTLGEDVAALSFRARLGLYYDLPDHTLRFVESTHIAIRARSPERLFVRLARIQKPGVKLLCTLRQFNILGIDRHARISCDRVYLAR